VAAAGLASLLHHARRRQRLGLAVARRIAISHGGEITIVGAEPRGTIGTVALRGVDAEPMRSFRR
jgi:hypothetical protein